MAVRDVPMSGTPDSDPDQGDDDEVDTETFAKSMMHQTKIKTSGSIDQTHYTARSDWSTKQRDADIDAQLKLEGLGEDGEDLGKDTKRPSTKLSKKQAKAEAKKKAMELKKSQMAQNSKGGGPWFSDQFVRNFSILSGACIGAAWEVATMPTTVQNFNKAVYAATGVSKTIIEKNINVDFYAMVLDVLSAVAYFAANVGVALGCVLIVVRMLNIFTGMGESALNFVCIPFTWRYAVRAVDQSVDVFNVYLTRYQKLAASVSVTAMVVEAFETVAPVTTRGLCLGLAFSFFAGELMQFAGGFVWVLGLLIVTAVARFILRMVLNVVSKVFPSAERLRDAMPAVSVVPGLNKMKKHVGAGAGKALSGAKKAGALAGKGAKFAGKAGAGVGGMAAGRAGAAGGAGAAAAVAGARVGAAVGAAAAKTTVYGFLAGAKGGVRAGLAAGDLVLRGTTAAGAVLISAPTFAWRSAGKIRYFVRLATVQAEVFVDPVAPRTRAAVSKGKFGDARTSQKLKL